MSCSDSENEKTNRTKHVDKRVRKKKMSKFFENDGLVCSKQKRPVCSKDKRRYAVNSKGQYLANTSLLYL